MTQIKNSKLKIKNFQRGFTLIEMLTVSGLVIVVGVIIASVITSSLRGSNKSNNLNEIRQIGNFIITQVSKTMTYAKTFDGVSTSGAANSYITDCTLIPQPAQPVRYSHVKVTTFNEGQSTFACTGSNISLNGVNWVDTTRTTVDECYFTCVQGDSSDSPRIDINFTLSKATTATGANMVENKVTTSFQTTVNFRNK